jgi:hypothetical protein
MAKGVGGGIALLNQPLLIYWYITVHSYCDVIVCHDVPQI